MDDLLLKKAEAFTDIETVCLEAWLTADQSGQPKKAHEILRTGLLAEHYKSLLDADPAKVTSDQSAQLTTLLDEFTRALRTIGRTYGG